MLPVVLLLIALAALAWFVKGDLGEYRRFKRLGDTASRQKRYRLWIAKAWLAFAAPALVGLALLGRLTALGTLPREFAPAAVLVPVEGASSELLSGGIIGAAIGGLALGLVLSLRRRRDGATKQAMLGDVAVMLPRNRAEVAHTALLSVTAGVTEEIAFRLFLPLLLVLVTGDAVVAFAAAALIFGAMHLYQGWIGVAATTVTGALLSAVYLATGSLAGVIALHVVIDLVGLVLRPLLNGAWRRVALSS